MTSNGASQSASGPQQQAKKLDQRMQVFLWSAFSRGLYELTEEANLLPEANSHPKMHLKTLPVGTVMLIDEVKVYAHGVRGHAQHIYAKTS